MDDRTPIASPNFRRALLRLLPKPEEMELSKMARRDPELMDFLRFLVEHDLREEAVALLTGPRLNQ